MKRFPAGQYGRQRLQFFAAPFRAPIRAFAGLVFPWQGDRVLVADILGRGWCIPSGRVEPTETSLDAVRREAQEEAGATLKDIQYTEKKWGNCPVTNLWRKLLLCFQANWHLL